MEIQYLLKWYCFLAGYYPHFHFQNQKQQSQLQWKQQQWQNLCCHLNILYYYSGETQFNSRIIVKAKRKLTNYNCFNGRSSCNISCTNPWKNGAHINIWGWTDGEVLLIMSGCFTSTHQSDEKELRHSTWACNTHLIYRRYLVTSLVEVMNSHQNIEILLQCETVKLQTLLL